MSSKYEYNNLFINIARCKKITESGMFCIDYILIAKSLDKKAVNKSAVYCAMNYNMELFDILVKHELFDPLYDNSLLLRVADKQCLTLILKKIVTSKNIAEFLLDIISYEVTCNELLDIISYHELYNNDVLDTLLSTYKAIIDPGILQTYLLVTVNNSNVRGFLLIIDKLEHIKKDILEECLQIACTKNIFPVINMLLDYSIDKTNIYISFDMALDNNNILAATIILPPSDDICNYITDSRISKIVDENINEYCEAKDRKEILKAHIKSQLIFSIKNLDRIYLENAFLNLIGRKNLLRKYKKYINDYDLVDIIDDLFGIR